MQKKPLFNRSAIDRVQSPEDLNDYIKVTTPSVWTILVAIIILLASLLVWGIFGTVEMQTAAGVTQTIHPIQFIFG